LVIDRAELDLLQEALHDTIVDSWGTSRARAWQIRTARSTRLRPAEHVSPQDRVPARSCAVTPTQAVVAECQASIVSSYYAFLPLSIELWRVSERVAGLMGLLPR
jgi:hypothetical protein